MNEEKLQQALKETQIQAEEAASKLGALLRKGAEKLRDAADAASEVIREDLRNRPE